MELIKYFIAGSIGSIGFNLLKTNTYNDFWINQLGILLIVLPIAALSYYEGYTDGKNIKNK